MSELNEVIEEFEIYLDFEGKSFYIIRMYIYYVR